MAAKEGKAAVVAVPLEGTRMILRLHPCCLEAVEAIVNFLPHILVVPVEDS